MTVTVELAISPHPKKDAEQSLRWAASRLAERKDSIHVSFPKEGVAVLKFWMRDKAQYKVVDDIFDEVKMSCGDFYEDIAVSFANDRKRKPRSRRR